MSSGNHHLLIIEALVQYQKRCGIFCGQVAMGEGFLWEFQFFPVTILQLLYTDLSSRAGMITSFVTAAARDVVSPHCCHLTVSVVSTEICTLIMYQDKHGIIRNEEMQIQFRKNGPTG
jgi:hypothetical protein